MENDNYTQFDDRAVIVEKLAFLANNKCQLHAHLGNLGTLSTEIVELNATDGSLLLDCGADEVLNKKIVTSPAVEFHALFDFTKVTFTGKAIKKITHHGTDAFLLDIPQTLKWAARRRHDRKKMPLFNSSFCEVLFPKPTPESPLEYKKRYASVADKIIRFSLYDISLSGCSMLNYDNELSSVLLPKMIFENCKIVRPDNNEIRISFEIMTKRDFDNDNGKFGELIGVKFLDIKRKLLKK